MKRRGELILFLMLIFSLFLIPQILVSGTSITGDTITGEVITGEVITGDATQSFGMNITITAGDKPTLEIKKPRNETYFDNHSIRLDYDIDDEDSKWFSIDDGANTTLTTDKYYFNVTEDTHILYLFAENSAGTNSTNVTFSINISTFKIEYTEFSGSTKGNSTEFTAYSYEEMHNLTNVTLEHTSFGKILFLSGINFTDDLDPYDNETDIGSNIIITSNSIEVNVAALPNFNRSASLEFYDLTFTNPQILVGGNVCPTSICTEESYTGGVFKFNVTGFSVYTSRETPSTTTATTGAAAGGGGGSDTRTTVSIEKEGDLDLMDVELEVINEFKSVMPGEDLLVQMTIYNLLASGLLDFEIEYIVRNELGEVLLKESETIGIETKVGFIKNIYIPEDFKEGEYTVHAKTIYTDKYASSGAGFTVSESSFLSREDLMLILITTLSIGIIILILEIILIRRHIKRHIKIDEKRLIRERLIKIKK